jgi:hypothetical protein
MKTKFLISTACAGVIALIILYSLLKSHPFHPATPDGKDDGNGGTQTRTPKVEMVYPHPPQKEALLIEEDPALPDGQEDPLFMEDEYNQLPDLEPSDSPNRDSLMVEPPPPELADDTRMSDSAELMEIELTGRLLDYDISDDKIDEILQRIRGGADNGGDTAVFPAGPADDYLKRLRFMVRLIDQSEMDSNQLTIVVEDIFNSPENAPPENKF